MTTQDIATAMQRMESVLRRRPDAGVAADEPAADARWEGGARVVTSHPNGTRLVTDAPDLLGGGGTDLPPTWLFRAGLASCAATRIAMAAAAAGIELATLHVRASSVSDVRGVLGIADAEGEPLSAGPCDVQLLVRISSQGVAPERLRELVDDGTRCSPVCSAVRQAVALDLHVEVDAAVTGR